MGFSANLEANVRSESGMDLEALRREILRLHEAEIEAHWRKDVEFFARDISENYLAVAAGDVGRPTAEEIRGRFSNYLGNTTFAEYKDSAEPIVGFSKDGSMAWAVFQIKVVGKRTMDDGAERELNFTCAWITLYERQGDRWMRLADVSTFK